MHQDDSYLDQRLTRFEARLDRFSLALHQWQQDQDQQRTSADPLQDPLHDLQAQTENLKELCAAAARSVSGLGETETRLAALQADVAHQLGELTRTLQAFMGDLRLGAAPSAPTSSAVWPLERVVQLHEELRRTSEASAPEGGSATSAVQSATDSQASSRSADSEDRPTPRTLIVESANGIADRGDSAAVSPGDEKRKWWYIGGAVAAAALLIFGIFRIESRLNEAGVRVAEAERQAAAATELANHEAAAARKEASQQIAEARQSAQRAETIGAVLTAPDLVRFNLIGTATLDRSSAQLLWSRTRGLVLSASRLPAAPDQTTYQLWLKTNAEPVSAGTFVPDETGRATLVADVLPKVIGPLTGAEVTVEPSGGRQTPTGPAILIRLPQS
jgi:hypothetical protein